jgi:uncharacterized protein
MAARFLDLLLQVGIERILFSADYRSMAQPRGFLDQLPLSSDRDKDSYG